MVTERAFTVPAFGVPARTKSRPQRRFEMKVARVPENRELCVGLRYRMFTRANCVGFDARDTRCIENSDYAPR
jgi:hypothetical protein